MNSIPDRGSIRFTREQFDSVNKREQFDLIARNLMGRKLTGDYLPPHLHFVHKAQKLIT
jgi:hypothetical protein